jgi:hypothetical protein
MITLCIGLHKLRYLHEDEDVYDMCAGIYIGRVSRGALVMARALHG